MEDEDENHTSRKVVNATCSGVKSFF